MGAFSPADPNHSEDPTPSPPLCYSTPTLTCTYSSRVTQRETLSSFERIVFFPTFCVQRTMSHNPQKSVYINMHGFPGAAGGKEPTCQVRRHKRRGFDPWVGKIPWRRKWQPTPVFLPGITWTEEPGQLQSLGSQRVRHDWSNLTNRQMIKS